MRKWYPIVMILAAYLASALVYNRLPERVPVHFDMLGKPNGWSSRLMAAFLLPTLALVQLPILRLLPRIDPRRANYQKFQTTYDTVIDVIVTFLVVIHGLILGAALGLPVRFERVMPVVVGALLMIVGNLLPRSRPNWWFGIRTPWTLSSDRVWERTHRVGGYLLVGAGILVTATAFLPPVLGSALMAGAVGGAAVGSIAYSYFLWRRESRGGGDGPAIAP